MNARLERCLAMSVMALVGAFACGDGLDGRDAAARNLVAEPPSSMEAWHGAMLKKNVPHHGCFSAHYPIAVWQESTCVTVPPIPHLRPLDRPRDHLVGNGTDFLATTSTSIGSILGYFPATSGISSEADTGSDVFTFQANSNLFQNANTQALCNGGANAAGCRGWQQFVYENNASVFTGVYIQYWLRFYQVDQTHPCPNGWTTYTGNGGECYRNGPGMGMAAVAAANAMANLRLGGWFSATGVGGSQDFVYVSNPNGQQLAAVSSNTLFHLGEIGRRPSSTSLVMLMAPRRISTRA